MRKRSPLGWLGLVLAKDGGVRRLAHDRVYGPKARHRLDIYAPEDGTTGHPLLLFFYGGGWDSGDKADYAFAGHAFAALGFVTAVADYRVYPEVLYPDFLDDGARAAEWLVQHAEEFGGDPQRLVLAGHSAGAYNAVMVGTDNRWHQRRRYPGAVKAIVGLSGPYDFFPFDVEVSIRSFGGAGATEESQPIHLDLGIAPPMFLAHGSADQTVRPRNTHALAAALRKAGRQVEEVHYQGVGHRSTLLTLFPWLRWRLPVYRDIGDFLHSTLG